MEHRGVFLFCFLFWSRQGINDKTEKVNKPADNNYPQQHDK